LLEKETAEMMAKSRRKMDSTAVKYSPLEEQMLKLMLAGKSMTTTQLVDMHYSNSEKPYHARAIVRTTMSNLIRKVEHNKENFRIVKGPRQGPRDSTFKIERHR